MKGFWETWRSEIIRGATLFCVVLAIGLFARYLVARAKERVVSRLPEALREIRGDFDPEAESGPRTAGATWTVHSKLTPKHSLWIRNTRGSVTVEPIRGDSVQIVAVKSYHSSDTGGVRLIAVPSDGGLTVCALWPGSRSDCTAEGEYKTGGPGRSDVAVDFTVRLPRGVRLDATTILGDIHVAGASAPLKIRTVSGDVDVETAEGPVSAGSVNGDVHARIRGFADTGAVSVTTVNGSATLELPATLDADVEANTINGAISTDYPLTVTGKFTKHTLKGTLGRGGRDVHITTVNGSVQLKKAASATR
jgi:Putative adhesin